MDSDITTIFQEVNIRKLSFLLMVKSLLGNRKALDKILVKAEDMRFQS